MCSVSFLPHARGFYLGMNRDESLQRISANPPDVFTGAGHTMLYPTEPAGGTWVGVNDVGLTLALINWYAPSGGDTCNFCGYRDARASVSRGIVVPCLLSVTTLSEVRKRIAHLPLGNIAPFRLLAFSPRERLVGEFRWERQTLDEVPHTWAPRHWFSSGYDEPRAQHERGRIASAAWCEPRAGSLDWLRRLHASHEPARGPFCFCMHRQDAASVSYTEVVVTAKTATMRYHDGPLCRAPQPRTTHRISLPATRKETAVAPTNQRTACANENHRSSLQPSRRPPLPGGVSPRRNHGVITH